MDDRWRMNRVQNFTPVSTQRSKESEGGPLLPDEKHFIRRMWYLQGENLTENLYSQRFTTPPLQGGASSSEKEPEC